MSTHEIAALTLAFFTGIAIGTVFFGGLWWTVSKAARRAALRFLISFLLRTTFVLIAFYLVGAAQPERLACVPARIYDESPSDRSPHATSHDQR